MANVTIYTSQVCPYCVKAKSLLRKKGVTFTEIDISDDESARDEMIAKTGGRRTVPQIFIGENHIGGCDDLYALDTSGKLDSLLEQ